MRVYVPIESKQTLGGGFTFHRNIQKALTQVGVEIVNTYQQSDVILIASPTFISKETFRELRDSGKKIALRLDNVPRNSRNRGTGTNRLRNFAQLADQVIWQGEWCKQYLKDFVGRDGVIIHNGADLDIFNTTGLKWETEGVSRENIYLYSRYSRDETKMWEVAWYEFQMIHRKNKDALLLIAGRFSDEVREYNFDFFNNERISYLGVIDDEVYMADVLRGTGHFIASYYNDGFANTYLEALLCGVQLHQTPVTLTGGTVELLELFVSRSRDYWSLYRMGLQYKQEFERMLNA